MSDGALAMQAKVEEQVGEMKKKMAAAEYAGRTPAKIKENDTDKLGSKSLCFCDVLGLKTS